MQTFYLGMATGAVIFGSVGVIVHVIKTDGLHGEIGRWKASFNAHAQNYATERRKRLEAEQAHTDLADKHNATLDRIESAITLIDSIPHRKGKETLIKAKLKGEAA